MATRKKRSVLITTEYRGVFFGDLKAWERGERYAVLENARMILRWGTTGGVLELCEAGVTKASGHKVGSVAPRIELCGVTAVADCTDLAAESLRNA